MHMVLRQLLLRIADFGLRIEEADIFTTTTGTPSWHARDYLIGCAARIRIAEFGLNESIPAHTDQTEGAGDSGLGRERSPPVSRFGHENWRGPGLTGDQRVRGRYLL